MSSPVTVCRCSGDSPRRPRQPASKNPPVDQVGDGAFERPRALLITRVAGALDVGQPATGWFAAPMIAAGPGSRDRQHARPAGSQAADPPVGDAELSQGLAVVPAAGHDRPVSTSRPARSATAWMLNPAFMALAGVHARATTRRASGEETSLSSATSSAPAQRRSTGRRSASASPMGRDAGERRCLVG